MRRRHALHRLHARHRGAPRPASCRHGCEVYARARAAHPARKRGIPHQARCDERGISLQAPRARQERRPAREGCRIERAPRAHTGESVCEIERLAKPATHSQPHARAAIESRAPISTRQRRAASKPTRQNRPAQQRSAAPLSVQRFIHSHDCRNGGGSYSKS